MNVSNKYQLYSVTTSATWLERNFRKQKKTLDERRFLQFDAVTIFTPFWKVESVSIVEGEVVDKDVEMKKVHL